MSIQQRKIGRELRHLLHIAHAVPGAHLQLSLIKAVLSCDTAKQRRFSRAIGPHKADLFSLLDMEVKIFKNKIGNI